MTSLNKLHRPSDEHHVRIINFLAGADQPSSVAGQPESFIDAIMNKTFPQGRDPRSDEYKAGVRAQLARLIEGTPLRYPYRMGTAQADAYFAGMDEGRDVWSRAVARATA